MQTFAEIIRSLFILTLIGALTYRLFLTLFFLHFHVEYLLHPETIPAIVYLLVSYTILILGLAYMYNKIYDIETKSQTLLGKFVGVCYVLLGILVVPVVYGEVLWGVGLKGKVDQVFQDRQKLNYGENFGISQDNMLRWYQISFYIQLFVFAIVSAVVILHLVYLAVHKIKEKNCNQLPISANKVDSFRKS